MSENYATLHDETLLQLAARHKNIDELLDTIFGFFARKTDLYEVMQSSSETRGFAPGRAEEIVLEAFRRNRTTEKARPAREDTAPSTIMSGKMTRSSSMSTFNGGSTDTYKWSQTSAELVIELSLPSPLKSRKDLYVEIASNRVKMTVAGASILLGDLSQRIIPSESTWTLEESCRITLTLQKHQEGWWKSVFVGDNEIDTTKIESKKRIDEYDAETQASIRKLLFDENQKRQGLLTSDEMLINEKLKGAWDAEGSPFAGTDFDPNFIRNRNM